MPVNSKLLKNGQLYKNYIFLNFFYFFHTKSKKYVTSKILLVELYSWTYAQIVYRHIYNKENCELH